MTDEELEALGLIVDRLDNVASAGRIPMRAEIQRDAMISLCAEIRDELRAFLIAKGFNPWE